MDLFSFEPHLLFAVLALAFCLVLSECSKLVGDIRLPEWVPYAVAGAFVFCAETAFWLLYSVGTLVMNNVK